MSKSLIQTTKRRGKITTTITYSYNLELLYKATGKLNGANRHPAHRRPGMFTRREDFESSTVKLASQLSKEHRLACDFASGGFDNDKFRKALNENGLRLSSIGTAIRVGDSFGIGSSFRTRDLSPALRHFINDYCRVLELLTQLVANKIWLNNIPKKALQNGRIKSFNAVVGLITDEGITNEIHGDFFVDIYDQLWNDYKHDRGATDVSTGSWTTDNSKLISSPKINAVRSQRFNEMPVVHFVDLSIKNLNDLLDYLT